MLNRLIPPEIKGDEFYFTLHAIARDPRLRTFLEIGSSSGEGSTAALVTGIRTRPDRDSVRLFCMEVSRERFTKLCATYAADEFVTPCNLTSVGTRHFPSPAEVTHFYNNVPTQLNNFPLSTVLQWLQQDIDYVRAAELDEDGIEVIKQEHQIARFDFVLIDGSEFTGEREFYATAGARVIACDDINAFKCFTAYHMLRSNPLYRLVAENRRLRNGFAVFERVVA
jgi:hypothetical protein